MNKGCLLTFFFAWCSVTKPATGYLYISWLTFKVRCKSMQGFLYCSVDFEEWCHHLSSDFMILMIIIANNHQMPRGRGGHHRLHSHQSFSNRAEGERERERDETKSLKANMSVWAYWAEHSSEQRYCGVCRRDTLHADRPAVRAAFKAEPISFWSPKSCILMWFSFSSSHAVVKVFSSFWANFWFASGLWWNMHEDQNTTT